MFIITTRKQFSESARRLANAFTIKSAVNMVTRSLRSTQRHALAESLELAFVGKFNDDRMGLPQANDLLANALSGEDQNITASKIKKNKSVCSTLNEDDSNRVQNYADNIKSIAFTLGNQVNFIESIKKVSSLQLFAMALKSKVIFLTLKISVTHHNMSLAICFTHFAITTLFH